MRKGTIMNKKMKLLEKETETEEQNTRSETAELNGVKVNPEEFEIPRTTIEMLEQTFQIA